MTNLRCAYKLPGQQPKDNNPWLRGTWLGMFPEGSIKDRIVNFNVIIPDGFDVEIVKIHDVRLIRLNISDDKK